MLELRFITFLRMKYGLCLFVCPVRLQLCALCKKILTKLHRTPPCIYRTKVKERRQFFFPWRRKIIVLALSYYDLRNISKVIRSLLFLKPLLKILTGFNSRRRTSPGRRVSYRIKNFRTNHKSSRHLIIAYKLSPTTHHIIFSSKQKKKRKN